MSAQSTDKEKTPENICPDCGDEMDLVGTEDGQGCYYHCWRCWYQDHPEDRIREYRKG